MTITLARWGISLALALALAPLPSGCDSSPADDGPDETTPRFNLAHLDHLGEETTRAGVTYRIVHIYAEAPEYDWVADGDEGASAVDDVARAAVVYLRHFELTGDSASADKARQLLRFVMYMQTPQGLFYNFVFSNALDINTTHQNSRADAFEWWAARAVWALGTGIRVLKDEDPAFVDLMAGRVALTYPHLQQLLTHYGQYRDQGGRRYPTWLVGESGADATSELLMGLVAVNRARPDAAVAVMIAKFGEGIAAMRFGSMNTFPYGAHASWIDTWHAWGNSQTQALSEAGLTAGAEAEALQFYPRLLVDGWLHSFSLADPASARSFEQIAYAVRAVSVGLVRLYDATGDPRYAKMAGLAASWLTGNNVASAVMYDAASGRGFDGIGSATATNRNSGAESTIEALFTVLEVERIPEARRWIDAKGGAPVRVIRGGAQYAYRVFTTGTGAVGAGAAAARIGVIMNLTDESLSLLEDTELDQFLAG